MELYRWNDGCSRHTLNANNPGHQIIGQDQPELYDFWPRGGCNANGDYCNYFLRPTTHCSSDEVTSMDIVVLLHFVPPRSFFLIILTFQLYCFFYCFLSLFIFGSSMIICSYSSFYWFHVFLVVIVAYCVRIFKSVSSLFLLLWLSLFLV